MCDKMNREKELKEAVDSLTTALEKEFGTPEERSKKDTPLQKWLRKMKR